MSIVFDELIQKTIEKLSQGVNQRTIRVKKKTQSDGDLFNGTVAYCNILG